MRYLNSSERCDARWTATVWARPFANVRVAAIVSVFVFSACSAAPPEDTCENDLSREYNMQGPVERWQLERNPIAAPLIPARRIVLSDERVPGIPACGFSRPVFWNSGHEVVVDQDLFTDLRTVRARQARGLDPEGIVVGRVRHPKHDPRQVVKLLVTSGVVDANIHVVATVSLMEEGRNSRGYWARLISDDRFWTNRENRMLYDFAVVISFEGEIRLMDATRAGLCDQPR